MKKTIALITPLPPPFGGMTVLGDNIQSGLVQRGFHVVTICTNPQRSKKQESILVKVTDAMIYYFSLWRILKSDIVLIISSTGNYFYFKAIPALLLSKVFGKKVILDFVGGDAIHQFSSGRQTLKRWIGRFDLLLLPTQTFKKAFGEYGLNSILFPHLVNIKRFKEEQRNSTGYNFLAVKSLEQHSNVPSIINAFEIIKGVYPESKLFIAGDGPERFSIEQHINQKGLEGVSLLGNIDYSKMPELFAKCDIFLHGTKYESFGIVLVEAMASSIPIVTTDSGGIPDLIEDGSNGFLIKYNDHIAMADRALKLLSDRTLFNLFVENGLKKAGEFDVDPIMDLFERILNDFEART